MSFDINRINKIVDSMGRARILILGDIMIDEYMIGGVERISPEAPVPVVEIESERLLLGGAANVAANILSLDDEPILIGLVGEDEAAGKLARLLTERGISPEYLVADPDRPTTVKTRVIAHSQQVVRVDREKRQAVSGPLEDRIMSQLDQLSSSIGGIIISDYGKGVISKSLLERVVKLANEKDIFVAVDPKDINFPNYRSVSLITPNHHEAGFAAGHKIVNDQDLLEVGQELLVKLDARSILITRGAKGMSLFERSGGVTHIPTFAREVYDVTGAGDTVIAVFVSAMCGGAELSEAAVISNAAAGYTVREIGTATIDRKQLHHELKTSALNGNLVTHTK